MTEKLMNFFKGNVKIYADRTNSDALMGFLTEQKIECKMSFDEKKSGVYADISPSLLKKIAPALDKSGIMVYIINVYGFLRTLSKYRVRMGMLLGAILFAVILWVSTLFVWRVELYGSENLSKEQLRSELASMGVSVGCRISEIDKASVSNAFLSLHPELSWAALNFNGTTVSLTVKETLSRPEEPEPDTPLIVAKCDGVVNFIGVYEGCAVVKTGTVVKKGDVLISGFVSGSGLQITDTPLLRTGNARGVVKAEVSGKITETVPLFETKITESSGDICGRKFSIFGHDISFGNTEGKSSGGKNLTVFGFIELPVSITEYRITDISEESILRTEDEAITEAEKRAYQKLNEALPDGEILKTNIEITRAEDGVTVELRYLCVTDICEKKTIGVQ